MPYLDEMRAKLKLEGGDVITEDWYDDLEEYLKALEKSGAIDYSGYMHASVIPDRDALYNLGIIGHRLKNVYSVNVNSEKVFADYGKFDKEVDTSIVNASKGNFSDSVNAKNVSADKGNFSLEVDTKELNAEVGNFSEQVYVQGKRVIKDEDPIKLSEFYEYAKNQITTAVMEALLNLGVPARPILLGYKVDYYAPAMSDVFPRDLNVQYDGIVRVKVMGDRDFYSYLKFKPNVAPIEIVAWLNDGELIKAHTWKEMDFTANKDDGINVKVFPSTRISIFIYNVPEA